MNLPATNDPTPASGSPDRWVLWVDGAGGFLILVAPEVSIGGPAGEHEAAIGVQADLHRLEAAVTRERGEYFIRALDGSVSVGGQSVAGSVPLRNAESVTLGTTATLWFHRPNPLSGTVRLTVQPRTRFRLPVDAVLLLDDTLVIGPTDDCHIRVPHAEGSLVVMRRGEQWQIKPTGGSAAWQPLRPHIRLDGLGVSMTLEPR